MRVLTRLLLLGILIVSCRDNIVGPRVTDPPVYQCEPSPPDTVFAFYPDSARLVLGAAERAFVEWAVTDRCSYTPLPGGEITWTNRDTAVAALVLPDFEPADSHGRNIVPRSPGATTLVVEAGGFTDSLTVFVPDTVVMGPVTSVAAGQSASCAVTEDHEVYCWGVGYGILGDWEFDPAIGTCFGAPCSPMPVPRATGGSSVHLGGSHACVLDAAGGASCWGENFASQLGRTGPGPYHNPASVSGGLSFSSLTLGWNHTCGLTLDGVGYCWGDGLGGKLGGNQRTGPVSEPNLVDDTLVWTSLDASDERTCGATDDGGLYCWGLMPTGGPTPEGAQTCEIAQGKNGPIQAPCSYVPLRMQLSSTSGADSLFAQVHGPCALTTLGSVYCYSVATAKYGAMSGFGFGPFVSLASGVSHTCGLTNGGEAWCWGANWSGELGDGTTLSRSTPVLARGGHIWTEITAGSRHTCGSTLGEVWCWGANEAGQTGTSILDMDLEPVKVQGQD